MGQKFNKIYINVDGIVFNESCVEPKNCSSFVSILNFEKRNLQCYLFHNEITSPVKLMWVNRYIQKLTGFYNYKATWAYSIIWSRVGEGKCTHRNSFQMVLVTNKVENFIIFNYYHLNFGAIKSYSSGFKSFNYEYFSNMSLYDLYTDSNIDEPGIWVYYVDRKNSSSSSSSSNILTASWFFLFYFSKYFE